MIINRITLYVVFALLLLSSFFPAPVSAQEIKKIIVFPFEIYSKENSLVIKESLYKKLSEELKKEKLIRVVSADAFLRDKTKLDQKKAIQVGKSLGADFIVLGSLTQFGESLSVDAKVIDMRKAKVLPPISVQGKGLDNIGLMATQLKPEILVRMGLIEKILKIEIKGNKKIEPAAIIQQIKSKEGNPFFEADITDDIKAIHKMGLFLDVSAATTSTPEGKIITFTVLEKGLITDIQIKGNKKIDKDDIREVMTTKVRESLNQEKIKADIEKIKALYDAKGYSNAEITDSVERDGEKDFKVVLDIQENDKIHIKSITFEGNEAYSSKELKNMMSTSEYGFFGFLSFYTEAGLLKRDQLKQDMGKIASYYFNNGFIHSQVGEPEITYDKKWIYIKIQINEGKRFKFGTIAISGDSLEKPQGELFASLKIKEGENYSREQIMKDIDFLTRACNDEGYAYADINPKIDIREKEQLADVDFQIIKGELVYFNRISISGNTVTRDKVIRRQLEVAEGDLYSSSKLKDSYGNLSRLRYFEEVDIQTEKGPDKNKMDANIRVKEKNTGMIMGGVGFSANDGPILMGQISQNNFLGYGQILSLKAGISENSNSYEVSFTEPWLFDIPLWCKADIWKYEKEYDSYMVDTYGVGLNLGYPIWRKLSGSVGYSLSSNEIRNVNEDTASELIKRQAKFGERITSSMTFGLGYDTRDDYNFPSKGFNAYASVTYAGTPLGGNVNLVKYSAGVSAYWPLFWDVVFVTKGRAGFIQNTDEDASRLPIYERYVIGGMSTVRGLRYVGPTYPGTSDVEGGTTMMIYNIELVFPLVKNAGMKGVVFYDAGNTWNYAGAYRFDDLRQSVGGGIRWYSPIGPLRLEYGYVIDRRGLNDDAIGRWEFTIGMFM